MREHLRFCLKINFSVNVGCVDGHMPKPCADGVDIDAGAKQVRCRRMPDGVGADRSSRQCWARGCDGAYVLADHPMNAMPR